MRVASKFNMARVNAKADRNLNKTKMERERGVVDEQVVVEQATESKVRKFSLALCGYLPSEDQSCESDAKSSWILVDGRRRTVVSRQSRLRDKDAERGLQGIRERRGRSEAKGGANGEAGPRDIYRTAPTTVTIGRRASFGIVRPRRRLGIAARMRRALGVGDDHRKLPSPRHLRSASVGAASHRKLRACEAGAETTLSVETSMAVSVLTSR